MSEVGREIAERNRQNKKAALPMNVIPVGIITEVSEEYWNDSEPKDFSDVGRTTVERAEHSLKTLLPNEVNLVDSDTDVSEEHALKAYLSIEDIIEDHVTVKRPEHS